MTQLPLGLTCGGALRPLSHDKTSFPYCCYKSECVGWVGRDIVGILRPDALGLHRYFSIRSQERGIQLARDE